MSQRIQYQFDLEIVYILLSYKTENVNVIEQYKRLGVHEIIQKPLTDGKLKEILNKLYNNKILKIIEKMV